MEVAYADPQHESKAVRKLENTQRNEVVVLIDPTTLADLEVFTEAEGRGGLSAMFVRTESSAGRAALHRRLRAPFDSVDAILATQAAVRFFAEAWMLPLLPPGLLERVERYLGSNIDLGEDSALRDLVDSFWLPIRDRDLCRELRDGVQACRELLATAASLARALVESDPPESIRAHAAELRELQEALAVAQGRTLLSVIRTDRLYRTGRIRELRRLMGCLAELDALRAMGVTTRQFGWTLPELVDSDRFMLEGDGLSHPFVTDPVANPVEISGGEPVVFLTGPNMAGKTTYMRAIGLVVFLAHVGMGVPAARVRMTPVDVLLTGLNPTDNLRAGLSYFYAEVLRVKEAAEHLAAGRRCLVLFDEVFKGTNVKDALEASLAVISAFARSHTSGCVFSSHLAELAAPLAELGRIRFLHFEGEVSNGRASYSFRIRPGVSTQRFGLQLLEEADVPALLDRIGAVAPAP